jgi:LPXTG-site transpeptidase (sortase) family protein
VAADAAAPGTGPPAVDATVPGFVTGPGGAAPAAATVPGFVTGPGGAAPAAARRRRPGVFAVCGVVLVIGAGATMIAIGVHGSGPPQPPASASVNAPEPVVKARPMSQALPVRITIPRIHVDAPVEALGQNADGTVEVPPLSRPNLAGWYKYGPTPGQQGAAVVLGHVDAHRHEAVFFRLGSLRHGDRVRVTRTGGGVATFAVDSVVLVPKNEFPAQSMYGKTSYAALRLVTCGGSFDKKTMHYLSNIIVYAHLIR